MTKINRLTLVALLTLIYHSQFYSQTFSKKAKEHHSQLRKNSKGLSLKVKNLKTVEKNGKTGWTVKTILTNHTRDTLFYFSFTDCEPAFYQVSRIYNKNSIKKYTLNDDQSLSIDFEKCGAATQTVISIPPSGKRTVNLEISYPKPVTSSINIFIYLSICKAKNMNERIPQDDLINKEQKERRVSIRSNRIKIKTPVKQKHE